MDCNDILSGEKNILQCYFLNLKRIPKVDSSLCQANCSCATRGFLTGNGSKFQPSGLSAMFLILVSIHCVYSFNVYVIESIKRELVVEVGGLLFKETQTKGILT